MAANETQAAKRSKLFTSGMAESCDLPDVTSEIVKVKVGGAKDKTISARDKSETSLIEKAKDPTDTNSDGDTGDHTPTDTNQDDGSHDNNESEYGEQIFYVHKGVLCKTSAFFQAATKPEWTGPNARPIDLTDEDPAIFKLYLQWLYSQKVAIKLVTIAKDEESKDDRFSDVTELAESYLLGEKLMDPAYQNSLTKAFIHRTIEQGFCPANEIIRIAYNGTTRSSPLRKLLVDFWVWEAMDDWVTDINLIEETCVEFANDLIAALLKARFELGEDGERPWMKDPKAYEVTESAEVNKDGNKVEVPSEG